MASRSTQDNASITIRPVRPEDLDAIVDIVKLAFPYDEQFAYRYPFREEFPEEHHKYLTIHYTKYINNTSAGRNAIMVAETPDKADQGVAKVVAFAIWDNAGTKPPGSRDIPALAPPEQHYERKDCSTVRLRAHRAATMRARKEFFVDAYGERQISLRQLATLPRYWGRGAGTALLHWGMARSREQGVPITLFAGSMGRSLYEKHGFRELGQAVVQVDGEDERIVESAMAWDPKLDTDRDTDNA
ncbi:hypothetical protein Hte_005561 [Hypoxylon texense]